MIAASVGSGSSLKALTPAARGLILDMDGVLWTDSLPIGSIAANFAAIRSQGLAFVAATNNATRTVDQYRQKFHGFGADIEPWQIVTSADATAHRLAADLAKGSAVFVVGEDGVVEALRANGFTVITDPGDQRDVAAVVAGIDRAFTYAKLQRASTHVRAKAAFYGTNADATFPTPHGLIPGAGAILTAIATAAECKPTVIGKPSPFMFQVAAQRMHLAPSDIVVVGDRLETDIAGGQAFGARTALVLSGVSTRERAADWRPPPDIIAADLAQLVGA